MAYLYLSIFPSLPATFAVFGSGQNSCCSPRRCFYLPSFSPRTRVIKAYHLSHTMKITILYSLCITDIYLMEELHHLGCGRTILKKGFIHPRAVQDFFHQCFFAQSSIILSSAILQYCFCYWYNIDTSVSVLCMHNAIVTPIFVYLYVSFGLPGAPHWGCKFSTRGVAETSPMKKSNHFLEVLKSFQLKHWIVEAINKLNLILMETFGDWKDDIKVTTMSTEWSFA